MNIASTNQPYQGVVDHHQPYERGTHETANMVGCIPDCGGYPFHDTWMGILLSFTLFDLRIFHVQLGCNLYFLLLIPSTSQRSFVLVIY